MMRYLHNKKMSFISKNPYTRKILKEIPYLPMKSVDSLISSLNDEYLHNKNLSREESKHKVKKEIEHIGKSLEKHKRGLAEMLTAEMGKPVKHAELEVQKCISHCAYYLANADSLLAPKYVKTDALKSGYVLDPLGVIYKIVPFNYPIWISFKMIIPTMLTGNAVLLRPANSTPQTGELLQQVFDDAKVRSVKVGFTSSEDTEAIMANKAIQGISFTGSTGSGSKIAVAAAKNLKRCVLELGGNDPFIVLDDADVDLAVAMAIKSRMANSGQVCFSSKRFFVQETVLNDFLTKLESKVKNLKVGNPMEGDTNLGPLARDDLTEKYVDQLDRTIKQGDTIVYGNFPAEGNTIKPSIVLVQDYEKSVMTKEEVFGPTFSVIPFKADEEAIEMANKTNYGLGATIISRDLDLAEGYSRLIDSGLCFINDSVTSHHHLPCGGVKESGFGRDCGQHGVEAFANIKAFSIKQ